MSSAAFSVKCAVDCAKAGDVDAMGDWVRLIMRTHGTALGNRALRMGYAALMHDTAREAFRAYTLREEYARYAVRIRGYMAAHGAGINAAQVAVPVAAAPGEALVW